MSDRDCDTIGRRLIGSCLAAAGAALLSCVSTFAPAADADSAWSSYGGTLANTRYSALDQINDRNVSGLKVAYSLQLGSLSGQESTPIVIDDTMYVASSFGPQNLFAIDARTGEIKWQYHSEMPDDVWAYACCDPVTRGVAYDSGTVFVGRLDGLLAALDAKTGKELWRSKIVDYKDGATITSPPIYAHGILITGYAGGELGVRGALVGIEARSGKELWRTYMTALKNEPEGDTWKGDSAKHGGGDAWNVGSYDQKTDTVLWGTGNPAPRNPLVRGPGTPDWGRYSNSYTAGTIALEPATGKIKWFYQHTPADVWDFDSTGEVVLADLNIKGKIVPTYMKADKNGFFFVVNRETGEFISADPFVNVTWAKAFDRQRGVPIVNPDKYPTKEHEVTETCPSSIGGKGWQPMAYNPNLGLAYIPANNLCMDIRLSNALRFKRGGLYLGEEEDLRPGPGGFGGEIEAWDPVKRQKIWSVKQEFPCNGGTMTTAGNLVFFGDWRGVFHALNAKTGEDLWRFNMGSSITAGAITYQVSGRQYVAVVAGRSTALPRFVGGELGERMEAATAEGGVLTVFALGG